MDRPLVRYETFVYDSSRWEGFDLRPDDIIISTPPKCGTTWTQMITALLIFQTPDLPARLARLSPWLDMRTRARRDVVADLEAQTHRRFIKTHTPLDGIPLAEGVTYICVGRDPRDVGLSMGDHRTNLDLDVIEAANDAAARIDGIAPPGRPDPPPPVSTRASRRGSGGGCWTTRRRPAPAPRCSRPSSTWRRTGWSVTPTTSSCSTTTTSWTTSKAGCEPWHGGSGSPSRTNGGRLSCMRPRSATCAVTPTYERPIPTPASGATTSTSSAKPAVGRGTKSSAPRPTAPGTTVELQHWCRLTSTPGSIGPERRRRRRRCHPTVIGAVREPPAALPLDEHVVVLPHRAQRRRGRRGAVELEVRAGGGAGVALDV